ncbi:CoA-transferase [Vibrio sp. S9_S30]|uniref:CoA-transferase n=1 Tax=Vibrio sp. S9_S30 TaxID=2720226 RepID=UPI0016819507|nr:CoA-transferase [Vibrio sp. S9_S30]MBD1558943.1 CoA-transferase [Vibrio sp. S9_S30]
MSLVKANRPEITSLKALAKRVESGSRLSVGGHHFARLPIALIREVCQQRVTGLRYFNWAGGLPLEMLLEANAVERIDICFSSLDVFGLAPKFRHAVEKQGIPMTDWPALALIQGLRAAEQNLPFLPMQSPVGSDLNKTCPALTPYFDEASQQTLSLVQAQTTDVLLLHAPRADESGNVELYGAHSLDKLVAGAAKQVLVTVEEIVPNGTLQNGLRNTILPRNKISAIAEVKGGAYPCSCLPYYTTDYQRLMEITQSTQPLASLLPLRDVPTLIRQAATLPLNDLLSSYTVLPIVDNELPATAADIMTIRVARMLDNNSYASAGAVSPLANVASRLAKASHAPDMMFTTLSGGTVDIQAGTMSLTLLESMDTQSAAGHTGGEDTYWTAYQGSLVTHEIVGTAQIDAKGMTNTLSISKPSGGIVRLPGQGGMADVANMHQHFMVYVPRHSPQALVEHVELCSAGRLLVSEEDRKKYGYRSGKIVLITNLCLFEFDENAGQLVVVETMPNVSRQTIEAQTGFRVIFSEQCHEMDPVRDEELTRLRREVDPLGIRRLEFVSAKERQTLLSRIIRQDRQLVTALLRRLA